MAMLNRHKHINALNRVALVATLFQVRFVIAHKRADGAFRLAGGSCDTAPIKSPAQKETERGQYAYQRS
jgi:hypothetical protein